MSRRAVRTYMNGVLQSGLQAQGITYLPQLPKAQPLVDVVAWMRMTSHEAPITLPRGAANRKEVTYKIALYVANEDPDEAVASNHHDDIVQAVTYLLRNTSLVPLVTLTDNVADPPEVSHVKYIGEILDITDDKVAQLINEEGAEAQVLAASTLVVTVVEQIQ